MAALPSARERLKFRDFNLRRAASGRCEAVVVLEYDPSLRYEGRADEIGSEAGELRCSAQAALHAITQAAEQRLSFELLGVKAVRAFDATVVIVSLTSRGEGQARRLVGSYLAEDHSPRGAALAVLNATNRVLGNLFVREGAK
jgi:hypothetical protein